MQQALSVSNPMLLVMENDGSDTYRSAQGGAMHLGEAVFMHWRNVLGHEPGGSDRQAAIEALASVSALARMIDNAELVGPDSADDQHKD